MHESFSAQKDALHAYIVCIWPINPFYLFFAL